MKNELADILDYLNRNLDPDGVRYLVIGAAIFVSVQVLWVAIRYAKRICQRRARALSAHVALIGLSYLTMIITDAFATSEMIDRPWNQYLPFRAFSFVLGAVALTFLMNHLSHMKGNDEKECDCVDVPSGDSRNLPIGVLGNEGSH